MYLITFSKASGVHSTLYIIVMFLVAFSLRQLVLYCTDVTTYKVQTWQTKNLQKALFSGATAFSGGNPSDENEEFKLEHVLGD